LKKAIGIFTARQGLDLSSKRITVSTAGFAPLLSKVWEMGVNLAVSINAPDDKKRTELMPINSKYPLKELVKAMSGLDTTKRQKLTAEYVLLNKVNDSFADADRLALLLGKLDIRINLIVLNHFEGCAYEPSTEERSLAFQERLKDAGFKVFIRKSKGQDILAACGQLAGGTN
jgi:23S rRNA (adenine2503-C2)-methyltransferase